MNHAAEFGLEILCVYRFYGCLAYIREPLAVAENLLSAINSCSLFCLNYRQWSFDVIRGDCYYRLILYYTQMNTNSFGATPIDRPYARRQPNSGDC